ncbi:hypothetical protein SBADM41S_11678 [Streptomyces badius]
MMIQRRSHTLAVACFLAATTPAAARLRQVGDLRQRGRRFIGGAGSISGTLWGVLLLAVIQNLINQIGSLNSSYQSVVSGGFLIVVVVAQRYLARSRRTT